MQENGIGSYAMFQEGLFKLRPDGAMALFSDFAYGGIDKSITCMNAPNGEETIFAEALRLAPEDRALFVARSREGNCWTGSASTSHAAIMPTCPNN